MGSKRKFVKSQRNFDSYFLDKLDEDSLTELEQLKIVREFEQGDFTNREIFIKSFIRLATSIGLRFHKNDGVSEALLALTEVPDKLASGALKDDNIARYVTSQIVSKCVEFMRRDRLMRVPWSTLHRHKKRGKDRVFEQVEVYTRNKETGEETCLLDEIPCKSRDDFDINFWITKLAITYRQAEILLMRLHGWTVNEIAQIKGINRGVITAELTRIALSYNELNKTEFTRA